MKHSKGPWRAAGLSIFQDEVRVARAFYNVLPLEEAHANAFLIAAAPDMLNAIDLVLHYADAQQPKMIEHHMQGLRYAAKKARGL